MGHQGRSTPVFDGLWRLTWRRSVAEASRAATRRRCCGVAFAKSMQAPSKPPDELSERVEKLEAEVAALKKMLKRLKAEVAGDAEEAG